LKAAKSQSDNVRVQALAVALDIYATTDFLGGGLLSASYGFKVTAKGVGAAMYNVGANGAAFGVANNGWVSVLDLLKKANANYNPKKNLFYGGDATRTGQANTVLTGINEQGHIR